MMKISNSEKIYKNIAAIVCVFFAAICLYPLLYSLFMSFATAQEIADNGGYILWWPKNPTLFGYRQMLNKNSFVLPAIRISILRTFLGTILSLMVTSVTGYALSRRKLPGKNIYMSMLLIPILFSGGLIPRYVTIQELGLLNSFWVMIIPALFVPFNVLIFKQFFEAIPLELEESSLMDGVNEASLFIRIILPLSKPVMAALGLFTLVGHWNDWFTAFLFINQSNAHLWPLQTYVMMIFNNLNNITNADVNKMLQEALETGTTVNAMTSRMALTILALLPILLVYPFFQKYFVKGVYLGAVKG